MSEDFIDELRNALDKGAVLSGGDIDARYHHDLAGNPAPEPRAIVRPRTTEDVSALLRLCHREGVPVTTQGGMTGLVRGALPNANEIVLSMERMNSVEEVDASAGVAIAQAGTPLQKLQERVEQDGLMFPLDLGARGSCTIGGNISTNAGGNRVIRYGMTRDLILGLEVVTADGTVLKGLRKYIKNNTGIDLKQLFIGSEGILGVVTRAALRVFPAPAERQVALCALPSFGQVTAFLRMARQRLGGELTAFEVMWNAYYRLAIDRMEEYADTLDARVKAIDPLAFTIAMGHVGDGNLHPSVYHEHTPEKHDEFEKLVYDITGEFGGSISAEHGIGILKRPYLKMSRTEEEIETMRALKRALDPKNILNPGRIFTM